MQTFRLKITSAVVIGGEIKRKDDIVTLTRAEAKNLLHRGRAVLVGEDDEPAERQEIPEAAEQRAKRGKGEKKAAPAE